MAGRLHLALLMLILAAPIVFADVGPGPVSPKVVVNLETNGEPETSVELITYNCMGVEEPAVDNAVAPTPINLSCSKGECTNQNQWYYKLNQCFGFPGGHFTYMLDGKTIRTESFEYDEEYDNYEITIDAPTGQLKGKLASSGSCNATALILGLVAAGAIFSRR